MTRRRSLLLAGLAAAMSGCQSPTPPTPDPTSSRPRSISPSATERSTSLPSTTPFADLTTPGTARQVVRVLQQAAGTRPVLKLDITQTQVVLHALDGNKPRAWRWEAGKVSETTSDIEYFNQGSFTPDAFAIDDVGTLFRSAAQVSRNASAQELQIVEQNPGSVVMVVTTRPESVPVFFRADGSLVASVDLGQRAGLEEALRDALAGRTTVTRVERQRELLYAESSDPKDPQATLRVSRPRKVPAFRTVKAETPGLDTFSASDIPVDVILNTAAALPASLGKQASEVVTWVIDRRDGRPLPTIRFTCAGETVVTDLEGRDITHEV